ncbi:MAG: ankyrin repeat domain-containing protein [Gammaproteobacteria bacterium]|nr:ankyrin repeat domain-containing protein [Gammaproteobacteria bacterium]
MSAGDWKDLYIASERGDLETVRYHLKSGVDPNYQHPEVMATPLFASIKAGHSHIVELLLEYGADPTLRTDFEHLNAWETAALYHQSAILHLLANKQ